MSIQFVNYLSHRLNVKSATRFGRLRVRDGRDGERVGAVVSPLACRAKVPGFKSRQKLSCPLCSKRVPDIRQYTILSEC